MDEVPGVRDAVEVRNWQKAAGRRAEGEGNRQRAEGRMGMPLTNGDD